MRWGALAPTLLCVMLGVAVSTAIPASASPADDYLNAVHRALTLVKFAERGDAPSSQQAVDVLVRGTGDSQPEILRDLRKVPPDLQDAEQRLQALVEAMQSRVDTSDPAQAHRQLRAILSQPRYSGLSAGPSWQERLLRFILDGIGDLLSLLGINRMHLNIPLWIWLVIGVAAILGIIIWPIRGGLSRGGAQAQAKRALPAVRRQVDFFAEADRLAAGNDYVGAVKALTGAVAVRLRGEHAWDRSPFTVRELFQQADRAEALGPLLISFEEVSYGHRTPDPATYARALNAAAPFRQVAA